MVRRKYKTAPRKWIFTSAMCNDDVVMPVQPINKHLMKCAMVYSETGPLTVYNSTTTLEAVFHSSNSDI